MLIIDRYAKVKKMLEEYKMIKINITNMQKEIEFISEQDGITGISAEGVGGSANAISNITERTALNNLDEKKRLEKLVRRSQMNIDSIDRALDGLNEIDQRIIKGFYISDLMWWQVAYSVGYSESHCKKRGADAIKKMIPAIYSAG